MNKLLYSLLSEQEKLQAKKLDIRNTRCSDLTVDELEKLQDVFFVDKDQFKIQSLPHTFLEFYHRATYPV